MGGRERGASWGVALACVCGGAIGVGIGAVMAATLGDVGVGIALGAGFAVVFAVAFQPSLDADPDEPLKPRERPGARGGRTTGERARPGRTRRPRALVADADPDREDDPDDHVPGAPRWDLS